MKYRKFSELTKSDTKAIKGIAILFMLALHLFCRRDNLPYVVNYYVNDVPILYYLGLWGDQCVALFCFCAGYASFLQQEIIDRKNFYSISLKRIKKLMMNYWLIVLLFSLIGIMLGKSALIPGSSIEFYSNIFLISNSYNGAWWFLLIYIILVLLSPLIYRIIKEKKK